MAGFFSGDLSPTPSPLPSLLIPSSVPPLAPPTLKGTKRCERDKSSICRIRSGEPQEAAATRKKLHGSLTLTRFSHWPTFIPVDRLNSPTACDSLMMRLADCRFGCQLWLGIFSCFVFFCLMFFICFFHVFICFLSCFHDLYTGIFSC